jgi:hypothetical protein
MIDGYSSLAGGACKLKSRISAVREAGETWHGEAVMRLIYPSRADSVGVKLFRVAQTHRFNQAHASACISVLNSCGVSCICRQTFSGTPAFW